MNKLAVPAILVATVMVAGMFAFMPVEQASTVHQSEAFQTSVGAAAGPGIRVVVSDLDDSTGLSGFITYDRTAGNGVFSIDALYLCDMESDSSWQMDFRFQTETSQTTGTGAKLQSSMGNVAQSIASGQSSETDDGDCIPINQYNFNGFESGGTGFAGDQIQLQGDENNNVIVFMRYGFGSFSGSGGNDGATIIAYISGVSTGDITATPNNP